MEGQLSLGLAPFVLDKSLLVVIHDCVLTGCYKKFDELLISTPSCFPFPCPLTHELNLTK